MALKFSAIQAILAFVFSFIPIVVPLNFSYPAVFNFGDSNSDTGGLVAGVAFPFGPPNGQTYFQKPSGRFCDGRLIIDFLMDSVDRRFLNPYLDSVGGPNFQKGCNFATGGSTILPANAASTCPFSFGTQVAQFVRFKDRVLNLLAKDKKFQKYLPLEDYFKQGLYMFDVGQNDIDGAFNSKSEDEVTASFPTILSEFEAGIKRLYTEGARNFWVHNTGPLGCLPRIIATFGKTPSRLDQNGCVDSHNHAANVFNSQLHDICTKFQGQFPDAHVTYVDIFSMKMSLLSNFSQYGKCQVAVNFTQISPPFHALAKSDGPWLPGFKQPLAACCGYGGPPLNFDNRIACGQTKILNGSTVTAIPCNNTAEYVNWDGNHYTEAANRYVSEQILAGNYSNQLPLSIDASVLTTSLFIDSKILY